MRILAIGIEGAAYAETAPWDALFDVCAGPGGDCSAAGEVVLTTMGRVAAGILEDFLDTSVAALPNGFATIGAALAAGANLLDAPYRLSGSLLLTQDPDAGGALGATNSMVLNQVTLDPSGQNIAILLRNEWFIRGENIEASIASTGGFALEVLSFALSLHHPTLWLIVLEGGVFPLIDPSIDSFEDLFTTLIDCGDLAEQLELETTSTVSAAVEASCNAFSSSATTALEDWMSVASAGASSHIVMATPSDAGCPIQSAGDPPAISMLGSAAAPCVWDATLQVDGGSSAAMTISWSAQRQ